VIDLHCHVLPDIDDGPRGLEDSLALCRASAALGVTTIVATPHVSWEWNNKAADIARRCANLNTSLREAGIPITVLGGAEVAISKAVEMDDDALRALCLGGGPWLLAEPPFTPGAAVGLDTMVHSLRARGHRLILAHPERCPSYLRDRPKLEALIRDGVLVSLTAGSLRGQFGRESKRFADGLIRDGLAHNVASDAHGVGRRRSGMADELRSAGFADQTDWLCRAVPQALIEGTALPPRPRAATRKGGLSRLFRQA
jgi:protein-tyrosine phosphatase